MKNKSIFYSVLFFILVNLMLFLDPFKELDSMIIFVSVFLICSVFFSVQFMVKEPNDKKLLKFIPKSLPGFFALALVVVCLIYLKMIIIGFVAYL